MRKVALVIVIGLGAGFAGFVPLACDDFESNDAPESDGSPDATASVDTGAGSDSSAQPESAAIDAVPDAAVRTVKCGEETCILPGEVCCVYFDGTGSSLLRFCAEGTCPQNPPTDASFSNKVTVSCDDPTDCETPGNVCCAASPGGCISSVFDVVECRAAENCISCADADGGSPVGYPLCRTTAASDCAGAECSGTFASYPQWSDYRFCK